MRIIKEFSEFKGDLIQDIKDLCEDFAEEFNIQLDKIQTSDQVGVFYEVVPYFAGETDPKKCKLIFWFNTSEDEELIQTSAYKKFNIICDNRQSLLDKLNSFGYYCKDQIINTPYGDPNVLRIIISEEEPV